MLQISVPKVEMGDRGSSILDRTKEEEDLLRRSTKKNKVAASEEEIIMEDTERSTEGEERGRSSYKEATMGFKQKECFGRSEEVDDGSISDDDVIEESMDPCWFGIGMTRDEKWRVQQPWWNSLIIKLVGRSMRSPFMEENPSDVAYECGTTVD